MPRGGKGNSYPEDFKRSAVEMALNDERSINAIAKELGLIEEKANDDLEAEIKRLKKENARLLNSIK